MRDSPETAVRTGSRTEERGKEDKAVKSYETVWEIFNQCPNNQIRDVFIDEIETDDPEEFIREKFRDKEMTYEKTVQKDGTIIFDIITSGIHQRYSFTEC